MKILVVTFNDSDNLTIENVLRELEKRGHELTIFAPIMSDNALRMFKGLRAPILPFSKLTNRVAKQYDVAFCTNMMLRRIKFLDIYIFVYSSYYDETFMTDGADFLFSYHLGNMPRCSYHCASMPVGDPKNDTVIYNPVEDSKRILFIDSGHIPFGVTGKRQIAGMILEMCRAFPTYEICIKPRWLRGGNQSYTHKNLCHLYDLIEESCGFQLPDNLNMLNEHFDLKDLIDSSKTVITLYSGATLNAMLQNKGLLVVSDWDNEDKWDIRNDVEIRMKREMYERSGCLVSYKEVTKYLPDGLKPKKEFMDDFFMYYDGASERIANVIEYVHENFLTKRQYPAAKAYRYETFFQEVQADPELTMNRLKQERIRDIMQQRVALMSYKFSFPVDFSVYYERLDESYKSCGLNELAFDQYSEKMQRLYFNTLLDNDIYLCRNDIDQSYYLNALYNTGRFEEILRLPEDSILCREVFDCYRGLIYASRGSVENAVNCFARFLSASAQRSYTKYQEEATHLADAYNYVFAHFDSADIPAEVLADLYFALYEQNDPTIVTLDIRQKLHDYLPQIAATLEKTDKERAFKCLKYYASPDTLHDGSATRRKASGKLLGNRAYRLKQKTAKFVRCFQENGAQYTFYRAAVTAERTKKKLISKCKDWAPLKILIFFRKKVLVGYAVYARLVNNYTLPVKFYLSAISVGDPYLFGRRFSHYLKRIGQHRENASFVVAGNVGRKVASLFNIQNVEALSEDEFRTLYNLYMFDAAGMLRMESLHWQVWYRHTAMLGNIEGLHDLYFNQMIEAYLGLEENEYDEPVFDNSPEIISELFEANSLVPGKTVVLSPYAKSVKRIPMQFWNNLASQLVSLGFSVCTNSASPKDLPVLNTRAVFIPILNLVPFLEKAGAVIGLRSGFLDIASSANCLKISISPVKNFRRGIVSDINKIYSLVTMYNFPDQCDLEYITGNDQQIIHQIISLVLEYFSHATQENQNDS